MAALRNIQLPPLIRSWQSHFRNDLHRADPGKRERVQCGQALMRGHTSAVSKLETHGSALVLLRVAEAIEEDR
jgi:hypothetical protein